MDKLRLSTDKLRVLFFISLLCLLYSCCEINKRRLKMKAQNLQTKKIKLNGLIKVSLIPKKEYDNFIALLELEIREFYKQNRVPP